MALAFGLLFFVPSSISGAPASTLTCKEYKDRLRDTIDSEGNKVAQIQSYHSPTIVPTGETVYEWDDIDGLTGNLRCGENDEFEGFNANINLETDSDENGRLKSIIFARLVVLSQASVCALTSSNQKECLTFVNKMFEISTKGFQAEVNRGEKMPAGTCDFYLFGKVDAELDVLPTNIDWQVGPGGGMDMASAKLALHPKRRDAD